MQTHMIDSKKIGPFQAPLTSKLDIDDVFDGRSCCVIDYLPCISNLYECEVPTHISYLVKKGVVSTKEGWICEYRHKEKCVELKPKEKIIYAQGKLEPRRTHPFGHKTHKGLRNTHKQLEETDHLIDLDDEEFSDNDENLRGEEEEEEEETYWSDDEGEKTLGEIFRLKQDDRVNYSKYVTIVVDTSRYYVFVSPMQNHVQVFREC